MRASLEKVEGGEIIVRRNADAKFVRMKAATLCDDDIRFLLTKGLTMEALNADPLNAPGVVPQSTGALESNLEGSWWNWKNDDDYVEAGGQVVVKDGAWQEVRFRRDGTLSAWHKGRIVWDGKWEILGPRAIRIPVGGPVGLVVEFDADVNTCKVANERATHGRRLGRSPVPDVIVGHWKWHGTNHHQIREDGTVTPNGVWKLQRNRNYVIEWNKGEDTDLVSINFDYKILKGKNLRGLELRIERMPGPP